MAESAVSAEGAYIRAYLKNVGITEATYDALRKSEAISFMPRRVKGQVGFSPAQLLALKTFALLRTYGLSRRTAAEAVEASFPAMKEFAHRGELATEADYKVGVCILALRGRLILAPLASPKPEVPEAGRIEFDLRGISALMHANNSGPAI